MVSNTINIEQSLIEMGKTHQVIAICYVDELPEDYELFREQIKKFCQLHYKPVYEINERIVFVLCKDTYDDQKVGIRLETIQRVINDIDISNFFVTIVTTNENIQDEILILQKMSTDQVSINHIKVDGYFQKDKGKASRFLQYRYGSPDPVKISLEDLTPRERYLLTESKVFCIYPWTHLHAHPTGTAIPCCHYSMHSPVGDCKKSTLREIWHDKPMEKLRDAMLNEQPTAGCSSCYEQEKSGFFSGRQSANKHHGHHIKKIETSPFEMIYWDIRFSNLCNLKCRSCGHIFSSQWYQDQIKLAGPEYATKHKALLFAGRTEIDMFDQLVEHFDYVEQIYFAGGEPLMMEEHYRILEELERRERFDVRLIYNTNFTQVQLKDRLVFDYWRKFDSVAVGASLDAMGPRAEYIRKGTTWAQVEANRYRMLEICPRVDFYISPTLSIFNAWHLPDFHKDWVEKGLLNPQDLNVNILQNPAHYRIDIAPMQYKQRVRMKYDEHLEWLRPKDPLQRATVGFESAIRYMMAADHSALLPQFRQKTDQLDGIRNERLLEVIPELRMLYHENSTF